MNSLEIPWREEFVTREGTEYGLRDVDLATKVAQVRRQLERGEVLVFFDTEASSCQLVPRDEAKRSDSLSPASGSGE